MKKITLHKAGIHKGELILVNKKYPIKDNVTYDNSLVSVNILNSNILLDYVAAKEYTRIINTLSCGNDITPISGYCSKEELKELYRNELQDGNLDFTHTCTPLEDENEHCTGLALDLSDNSYWIDKSKPMFSKKSIGSQFRKLAPLFGFIERYPKNKKYITGVEHKPWHYRYVGYPHSKIMDDMDLTMEEYITLLNTYSQKRAFKYKDDNTLYKIFSIPVTEETKEIQLPDNTNFMLSGNNVNGFILTLKFMIL